MRSRSSRRSSWNGQGLNGATDGGAGWEYTADKKNASDQVTVTGSPATTDATSATSVSVAFANSSINSAPINVTEVLKPSQAGYTLVQQNGQNATCVESGTTLPKTVTNNGTLGWTVDALRSGSVTCTVYNRQPPPAASLTVVKKADPLTTPATVFPFTVAGGGHRRTEFDLAPTPRPPARARMS